jgi:hypothetical protein
MSYVQGTVVRVSAPFTAAADGAPVEPAEVVLRIDKPGNEPTTELELTSGGVINDPAVAGGYYADLEISADLRRATSSAASFSFIVVDRKALAVRQRVGYQLHPRIVQCLARGERAERLASAVGVAVLLHHLSASIRSAFTFSALAFSACGVASLRRTAGAGAR